MKECLFVSRVTGKCGLCVDADEDWKIEDCDWWFH